MRTSQGKNMLHFELDAIDGLPTGKHANSIKTLQTESGILSLPDNTDIELLYTLTEHYREKHSPENFCPFCVQCSKLGYTDKDVRIEYYGMVE